MNKSFIDIFREQVQKSPDNIAVAFEGCALTYLELDERSNQLAHYLVSAGVKENIFIPLFVEPGISMMVGMLGIMKATCAYVPIDINAPRDRINYILSDTSSKIVVCSQLSSKKLNCNKEIRKVQLESVQTEAVTCAGKDVLPSDLAYIIYTSGTTGNPKGVMVEHGNLADYISGLIDTLSIHECESFALVSTIATDLGNTVIYGSLATGGTLHIFSNDSVNNIEYLHGYFNKHKIDCLKIVASHWKALTLDGNFLMPQKLLIFGGEALHGKIVEEIKATGSKCRIVNHYGPTETTIGKLLHIVDPQIHYENTVPIGKTFSDNKVLVLTKNLKLCPIGVPGQLYITGKGVARGYLNNPELTSEKFIRNPFSKEEDSVMYSTGDMVKYLPDRSILFIGRVDNQVKIRGYRIELEEVESTLQKSELVNQAVLLARDDKQGNKQLVAYIIPAQYFDKESLLNYLKDQLPDYMIPAVFVEIENLPLTPNGKVDRAALPDPETSDLSSEQYVAPRNETESKLVELWENVLEIEPISIHGNFFELGGHSLLAVRLVSAIRKKMGIQISLNDLFIYPTIFQITTNLNGSAEEKVDEVEEVVSNKVKVKYLVPVKAAGKKMPLYIVAGGGGTALRFMKFAELMDTSQPVFVLQPPADPKDLEDFPDTIEDISKKFIEEIMVKNPEGPYALSGHCRGGIIAFEMAKQLKEMGKTVNLLAMFDTIIRKVNTKPPAGIRNFYYIPQFIRRAVLRTIFKIKFETFLLTKHTKHAVNYKLDALKKSLSDLRAKSNGVADKMEYAGLEIFNESMDIYANACNNYHLHPLDKEIVLFYAKDHYYFMDAEKKVAFRKYYLNDETKNMWHHYAKNITIHEIEGEHSSMFDRETAGGFAKILQGYLNSSKS